MKLITLEGDGMDLFEMQHQLSGGLSGFKKAFKKAKKVASKNSNIVSLYANAGDRLVNSKYAPKSAQRLSPYLKRISDVSNKASMNYIKQYAGGVVNQKISDSGYADTINDAKNEYQTVKQIKDTLPKVKSGASKYSTTEYEATKTGLQPKVKSGGSPKTPEENASDSSTMLYVGGAVALIGLVFLMKGKKK